MKNRRSLWTPERRDEFVSWHQRRLAELEYPPEIVRELERARNTWLSQVRIIKVPEGYES